MNAKKCFIVAYTYWGNVITEVECKSIRQAMQERKKLSKAFGCHSTTIYDAETKGIIN